MSSHDTQSTRGETKPFVKDKNVLNKTEEMRGEIIQHISYAINAYIDGDPGYVAKPYAEKIMQVIAQHDTALLAEVQENLLSYRGAYIGVGGKRVDDIVHHSVVKELIATYGKDQPKREETE